MRWDNMREYSRNVRKPAIPRATTASYRELEVKPWHLGWQSDSKGNLSWHQSWCIVVFTKYLWQKTPNRLSFITSEKVNNSRLETNWRCGPEIHCFTEVMYIILRVWEGGIRTRISESSSQVKLPPGCVCPWERRHWKPSRNNPGVFILLEVTRNTKAGRLKHV